MTRRLLFLAAAAALAASAISIPRPAGEVKFETGTGTVLLSQYKGKVTVIAFVLIGCEDCFQLLRALNPIQREMGIKGLQVLAGAFNATTGEEVTPFARQLSPTYPVGAVEGAKVVSFTQVTPEMKPTAPIMVIVDRKGIVRAQFLGSDKIFKGNINQNLRAEFEKYLK